MTSALGNGAVYSKAKYAMATQSPLDYKGICFFASPLRRPLCADTLFALAAWIQCEKTHSYVTF